MINIVNSEDISAAQPGQRWSIDWDWFPQNKRSSFPLVLGCLCPACRERLATKSEASATELLAKVRDCCGESPDFISRQLPILACVFRLFLANENSPLDLNQLCQQLNERRHGEGYRCSPEILSRLLENDQFYGLRPVPD